MLFDVVKATFLASILIVLSACGGGGKTSVAPNNGSPTLFSNTMNSSSSSATNNNKISQNISFDKSNIATQLEYHSDKINTISNALKVLGTGHITYQSSNTAIASVDNSGIVSVYSNLSGSVSITATIAADGKYQTATASYTIDVNIDGSHPAPDDITVAAWIGEKNTLINFPSTANGFTFFSSSESDCDFTHVANCADGQFDIINNSPLINTATTLNHPGNYLLKDIYDHTAFRIITKETFEPRTEHQIVNFNNALWLVGGFLGSRNLLEPELKNDVWSSTDGTAWKQQTTNAGFSTRIGHRVIAFNNSLWLIGGNDRKVDYLIPGDDNGRKNDIWSSPDGIIWTQQVSRAAFSPRMDHAIVNFNNKLWLIGGNDKTGNKNDVWSSANGITWIKQTNSANFTARSNLQVVTFNNKLWLIGSSGDDVWSSNDGAIWTHEIMKASFSAREDHKVVVHNNKIWLIAGYEKNDVWATTDGITWVQQTEHAAFSARNNFQLVSFDNKLVIAGGSTKDGLINEVWSSSDGIEWRKGFSGTFQFSQ